MDLLIHSCMYADVSIICIYVYLWSLCKKQEDIATYIFAYTDSYRRMYMNTYIDIYIYLKDIHTYTYQFI